MELSFARAFTGRSIGSARRFLSASEAARGPSRDSHLLDCANQPPVVVIRGMAGSAELTVTSKDELPRPEIEEWIEKASRVSPTLYDAISEPLGLLAAARARESGWLRFTLGWAVLERLAANVGSVFDGQIVVEQRRCQSCGADITDRRPTLRPRLEKLVHELALPQARDLTNELARINNLRGRSHAGEIPDGSDLLAPERLAAAILKGIVSEPTRVPL
jgi:hypothetical protein